MALMGALELIRFQNKKFDIVMANYKADLEMTLLHAHNFTEYMDNVDKAMKETEATPPPIATYH